ncbi:sensor histidine kinase [Isoptericola sp. NPDC056573]|uniref:sensor histidine kinase n=1 Tax=Isoptericola sp. NPDC056573 TaxID=3345868 RepID=UPI003698AAE9
MPTLTHRLFGPTALHAAGYTVAGLALAMLPTPFALVAGLAVPMPPSGRVLIFVGVWATLLVAVGLIPVVHDAYVRVTDRLLGTNLGAVRPAGGRRVGTGLWTLVHAVAACLACGVCLLLVLTAVAPLVVWLDGGGSMALLRGQVTVPAGPAGAWTVVLALLCGLLAAAANALVGAALRTWAPLLLGPRQDDLVAAAEERAAVLAERNRLARELHDSIGHTLTASTIQAAVASRLVDVEPHAARAAMASIEQSSRVALEDLDHALGLLRDESAAPRRPQRTLADLPELLDHVRRAGTPVSAELGPDATSVPATISREAYRIVQEGLTNAMRHARRAPVRVSVEVTAAAPGGQLTIEVANPMPAGSARAGRVGAGPREEARHGGGHGLRGVAERARTLRGAATFGPVDRPEGPEWRLSARLPLSTGRG